MNGHQRFRLDIPPALGAKYDFEDAFENISAFKAISKIPLTASMRYSAQTAAIPIVDQGANFLLEGPVTQCWPIKEHPTESCLDSFW